MNNHRLSTVTGKRSPKCSLFGVLTLVIFFSFTIQAISQPTSGLGKYGASFLQINSSARQVAMGGSFTGLADDINLLAYNIGGLGLIEKTTLGFNYHNWINDTRQGVINFGMPNQFGFGSVGVQFAYFNEGEITEFDETFTPTGAIVNSNDIAMTLALGFRKNIFGLDISFGGGPKVVRQNLADQSATALGLDLGFLIKTGRFSYGATVQNLTITDLKFLERSSRLPETYRGGVGYSSPLGKIFDMNMVADIAWLQDQKVRGYYGAEIIISDVLAIRGGYKFHDFEANRWGAGIGLLIPMRWMGDSKARFDYAFCPLDALESSVHRFSLIFTFRELEKELPGDFSVERAKFSELTDQLKKELEAAEKARLAAEEAERKTKELQQLMEERLARVRSIAEASEGKIEVHPESAAEDSILLTMRINFDFDRANIRPDEFETMKQVGEILNTYPGTKVQISGHTCFIGTEEYNIRLSHRRIDSVMVYLHEKENVEFDRFYYPVGYGKQRPVASNETREGRAMNRRVDFIIYTTESEPPIPEGSAIKSIEKLDEKTVKIVCNGRVNNYQDSFISNPDRIILDFPGIFLLTTQKTFDISNDVFIRARAAFHHDDRYSRIVLDLRSPVQYRVITKDNNIYVREL